MKRYLTISALAVVLLGGGCGDGRGDIEVRSTTSRAPKALPKEGPAVGTYAREWSRATPGQNLRVVGGQVLAGLGDGIQAYDVRTGRPTWHYREADRNLLGYAVSDGVVVINTSSSGDDADERHTAGLEASTGKVLWENTEEWSLTYSDADMVGVGRNFGQAAGSTVVVEPSDAHVRIGVDVKTGDERWSLSAEDLSGGKCDLRKLEQVSRADGAVVPVRMSCAAPSAEPGDPGQTPGLDVPRQVFAAVDADSGTLRWRQYLGQVATDTSMQDGMTLLARADGLALEVVDPNGRRVFDGEYRSECTTTNCMLAISGRYAVLTYTQGGDERIAIMDTSTGTVRNLPDERRDVHSGLWGHDDAGHFYRLTGLRIDSGLDHLLPTVIERLDLATGQARRAPVARPGLVVGKDVVPRQVLVAAGDQLVLGIRSPSSINGAWRTLEAYQWTGGKEPYELGGVRPEDWPDPCRLFAGVPLDRDAGPVFEENVEIGSLTIPRIWCAQAVQKERVEVTVNWLAATPKDADKVLDGRESSVAGADEEVAQLEHGRRVFRAGRAVVTIGRRLVRGISASSPTFL